MTYTAVHEWLVSIILTTWEAESRRIAGQILQETPISKITRAKWTGGMAQVVKNPLCNCKALNSNLSPTKII
jgi:hypothetical protein